MSGQWRYSRGIIRMSEMPRTEIFVRRRWEAWTHYVNSQYHLHSTLYAREIVDNDEQPSTDEDASMDYNHETSQADDSTLSSTDDNTWWDAQESIEEVIAYYACGNRPLTGFEKNVLPIIRQYLQG